MGLGVAEGHEFDVGGLCSGPKALVPELSRTAS